MTPEGKVKEECHKVFAEYGLIRAGTQEGSWPYPANGWYYMPVQNGMGVASIPDFVGVYRGHMFAVETKAGKGKPTPGQQQRMREIKAGGGFVRVAYSGLEARALLLNIDAELDAE